MMEPCSRNEWCKIDQPTAAIDPQFPYNEVGGNRWRKFEGRGEGHAGRLERVSETRCRNEHVEVFERNTFSLLVKVHSLVMMSQV